MTKRYRASSTSLFLMELILSILFFSIAAAICVSVFVRSHAMSREASDLSAAVGVVQQAAEGVRSCASAKEAEDLLGEIWPAGTLSGDTFTVGFDADGSACLQEMAVRTLTVVLSESDGLMTAEITCTDAESGETLFAQDVVRAGTPAAS